MTSEIIASYFTLFEVVYLLIDTSVFRKNERKEDSLKYF